MFEETKPPAPGALERARQVVKAAAGAFSPLSAVATELFDQVLAPVFRSQRDEWLEDLAQRLKDLERRHGITLADLRQTPGFLDAVFRAADAAARSH